MKDDTAMRAELPEAEAGGEIAPIYAEIRRLCAVPYVSSLQRHLATRPGWLEWAWGAVAPVFRSGLAQEGAWRLAGDMQLEPLPALSRPVLRRWGVAPDDEATIRAVCDSFIRVSPVNMVFSSLIKALLQGEGATGKGAEAGSRVWTPPPDLPPLPALVDPDGLPEAEREILLGFRSGQGAAPFVPGLYRMLAHWPGLLAHLHAVLAPRLAAPAMQAAGLLLGRRIDELVPRVMAQLPPGAGMPPPPSGEHAAVLMALQDYRVTSPQMVIVGRLIREAMPD